MVVEVGEQILEAAPEQPEIIEDTTDIVVEEQTEEEENHNSPEDIL